MKKITPGLYDELNASLDTTWPDDPAVPELPPMPVTDDPQMNQNAFLWTHFKDNVYPPREVGCTGAPYANRDRKRPTRSGRVLVDAQPIQLPGVEPSRVAELQLQRQRQHSARPTGGRTLDQGRQWQGRRPV